MSEVRPARWPWVALGVFFSFAITGMIGVAVNGESLAEQIPNVIAFTLFGIVGALLLSRLPGNRVGGLLLFGAAVTAACPFTRSVVSRPGMTKISATRPLDTMFSSVSRRRLPVASGIAR